MGSLSVSTHRGPVHCQGFLLVVSLLSSWSQPTTAQVTVESVNALEGMDVILRVRNTPPNVAVLEWYQGEASDSNHAIAYLEINDGMLLRGSRSRQETVNYDGSLMLKNVTMKQAGIYTILVQLQGCNKILGCGRLNIYPLLNIPTLLASNTTVTESKDAVVMTCYTNASTTQWLFNGAYLQPMERIKLSADRRNLIIDPAQREDAGYYQCEVSNPMNSARSAFLALDVKFE